MVRGRLLNLGQLIDVRLTKPREVGKRDQQLFIAEQEPEAILGHVGDFRRRSGGAKCLQFPSDVA
jgi:hypothetical protein